MTRDDIAFLPWPPADRVQDIMEMEQRLHREVAVDGISAYMLDRNGATKIPLEWLFPDA